MSEVYKPWEENDHLRGYDEHHIYDGTHKFLGTWYGPPSDRRWAQWCVACNKYFTTMQHTCPVLTAQRPEYISTINVPPAKEPPKKGDPLWRSQPPR